MDVIPTHAGDKEYLMIKEGPGVPLPKQEIRESWIQCALFSESYTHTNPSGGGALYF